MKHFVIALLVLALIAGFCVWGTAASTAIVDEILGELHCAPTDTDTVPENAREVSQNVLSLWEEKFFTISMFLPHEHLDEIKQKMVSLNSYASSSEAAEWREAHAILEEALYHLRNLIQANIDNIL